MATMQIVPARPLDHCGPISCFDSVSDCTLTMAEPATEQDLFAEYYEGAVASYSRFGVADAIDPDVSRCAEDTALFWTMRDGEGQLVGGVRAKGPLATPDDAHASIEWAGRPGEEAVRTMIADRLPYGVLEFKAAWLSSQGGSDRTRVKPRVKLMARAAIHAMTLLDINFCLATSAAHTLEQWQSSGGVIAPIPATPYPDERYQTKMLWWDRRTFQKHADPDQLAALVREAAHVQRWANPVQNHGERYAS